MVPAAVASAASGAGAKSDELKMSGHHGRP
jgi:hypothetical protein